MTLKSKLIFSLAVIIMTVVNSPIQAKSYHWDRLSQEQYVNNLVDCQIQIKKFKWELNNSIESGTKIVRTFNEVFDLNIIRQQVIDNLKMQNILSKQFNINITTEMLQYDINRMAANTKDAQSLKAIYALLDNDATTIAQCISRPYLVRLKTQNNYDYNQALHSQIKKQAQVELRAYLNGESVDKSMGQVNTVNYATHRNLNKKYKGLREHREQSIELTQEQFTNKIQELQNNSLQETANGFFYSEVVEQSNESIEVETIFWPKYSFNLWIEKQKEAVYIENEMSLSLILPEITGSNSLPNINTGLMSDTWESFFYVPDGRSGHTAIWTGNEMIIWGGNSNTGGRYDPSTDSWQPTSTGVNVPSSRKNHTAIWDSANNQMIVWGGSTVFGYTNTGGRYNPSTDSWLPTTVNGGVPSARDYHTAIWDLTNNQMIVWGGYNSSYLNTGGRYDPSSDSWQTTSVGANVPTGRWFHSAIWDSVNTNMIVWGGSDGSTTNTGSRYNPNTDSWQSMSVGANVPNARDNHSAIWDALNNQMIIWGGFDGGLTNTGGRYNPNTDSWLPTSIGGNVPIGRNGHIAIWDSLNSQMIIWGGFDGGLTNTGGRYNPNSDSWQSMSVGSNIPSGRSNHTVIWDTVNSQMIVWGGFDAPLNNTVTNTGGRYNPINDSWQTTSIGTNVPSSRQNHTAVWDASNNQMIIWGGIDGSGYVNTGSRYSPITDVWQSTSTGTNVPNGRILHTAIWDVENNQMIIWGGIGFVNTGGRYNPNTDSWQKTSISNVPNGREGHTAIWDVANNQMIIWGGFDGFTDTNSGGRYNPNLDSWQQTSIANAPNGREGHTAIWDTFNSQMIVWGGGFNTGGRYNPGSDSWLPTSIGVNVPSGRSGHTTIWDNSNNQMIVWGGDNFDTGGRYNPSTDSWLPTSIGVNVPTGRYGHTAIWDTVNDQMIVWGGAVVDYTVTGGRYKPDTDSWEATNTLNAPRGRLKYTHVWTGSNMIIWGGQVSGGKTNSMGIYNPGNSGLIFNDGFE